MLRPLVLSSHIFPILAPATPATEAEAGGSHELESETRLGNMAQEGVVSKIRNKKKPVHKGPEACFRFLSIPQVTGRSRDVHNYSWNEIGKQPVP